MTNETDCCGGGCPDINCKHCTECTEKEGFKGVSWRRGFQQGRNQVIHEASQILIKKMLEYANTPLDKRGNGWEWLDRARGKIEKLKKC